VTLNDTVSNTIVVSWDFGDGTIVNTGVLNPITHTYSPPQKVYLVTVTRLDTITGITSTGQKNVIIIDEKANFVPSITDICQNTRVNFNTIGIDSSKIRRYTWDFGDGTPRFIINNQTYFNTYGIWLNGNTNHTYATNGVFYVKLIIEDRLGCLDSLQYPVPISVAGPVVGFTASNLTSCDATQTVVFQDTSIQNGATPITEWRWNFGDGSPVYITTVDTPITHIYNNPAYYNFRTVTLTIRDAIGCSATVSRSNYIRGYRPRADFFSYDTIRCNTYNVFLYNYSSAYNATYVWHYGDGTTSTGYYGSHTYATNGMYNIKLVVTDENGCKDSITKPSYIKIIEPIADFNVGDTSQCAPAAITFTDNSQYATAWEWDFGDGGTGSTDRNPAPHIYALPGFYQVTLAVRGVNNCVDTVRKTIRVRGPIATWNLTSSSGCKPYTFTAKVTGSFINTYAWDFGDGTPVNASLSDSVISHTYLNAGKYLPNVVLISPEGCPFTLKLQDSIIVDSAMANFSPQTSVFCGTGTVSFNDLSVTPAFSSVTSYEWNFGDGSPTSNSATPPPHVYGPGDYTVSLAIQSQYGCRDTIVKPIAVRVNALPTGLITGDSIRCAPGIYQYGFTKTSADAIQTYQWTVNGVPAGTNAATLNHNFAAGNYTIRVTLTTVNNCSSFVERTIIVDSVNANFNVINPVRCGDDLSVNFNNTSGSHFGINGWLWNFGDNTTSPQQVPPTHVYPNYGVYNVSLIATSVHGCRDTFKIEPAVTINPLPSALIVGDSIHCAPGTYQYSANINSIDAIQTYQWTVNGANAGTNASTLNHNFTAGNYTIGLRVTTVNDCIDFVQRNIIIDSVNADFTVINPIRCADDLSVSFTNNSGSHFGINTWHWNFGDNTTSPLQNPPAHIYPGHGNYNVMLAITSVHGCVDTFRIVPAVTINPMPSALIVGDSIHCAPGTYQYSANINSIDAIQTYQWTVNGAAAGTNAATLNHNFTAGNYTIGLRVTTVNDCIDFVQRN
ncbi:MAG: PKD domain-containing protein, partial [Sphingobacteriales bacterium]